MRNTRTLASGAMPSSRAVKARTLATLVGVALIVWPVVGGPPVATLFGVGLHLAMMLVDEAEADFPIIMSWGMTGQAMVVGDHSVFVLLAGVEVLKVSFLALKRRAKVGAVPFVAALSLVILQVCGELGSRSTSLRALTVTTMLVLFVFIACLYDWRRVDLHAARTTFISTTVLGVTAAGVAAGGDLAQFVEASDNVTRFGEATRTLGGAMDIPLYVLASISILVLMDLRERLRWRAPAYFLIVLLIVAGLLTVSRVFWLGLAVLGVGLLLCTPWRRSSLRAVLTIVMIAIASVLSAGPTLNSLWERVQRRTEEAGLLSGRLEIYVDSLSFLRSNPIDMLFGRGATGYVAQAQASGDAMGMMAHNLALDAILSWGVLGILAFLVCLGTAVRRASIGLVVRPDRLALAPGVAIAACFMTGGSFWYFSAYVILLASTVLCLNDRSASSQLGFEKEVATI